MNRKTLPLLALLAPLSLAEPALAQPELYLPAQRLSVDLSTGDVTRAGITGQCLETVSRAGPYTLVVAKAPGDDAPTVSVNGLLQDLGASPGGTARIGGMRVSRDGSLVHVRTWKSGDKQTELLQDGTLRATWPRGTTVKLLRMTERAAYLLIDPSKEPISLQKFARGADGALAATGEELATLDACTAQSLRIDQTTAWAQMRCTADGGAGIFKIDLEGGTVGPAVMPSPSASFVSLPRSEARPAGTTIAVVAGTPTAVQFYHAVTGLLLGQTGEVRACSSDAEGLQSWNQSGRLRALSLLYKKTGAPVFADLAVKSMRLTLAARDGERGRATATNPACGWSSKIYSSDSRERLSLMINQAMIANALTQSCAALGGRCPAAMAEQIAETTACLATAYEPQFDDTLGVYRIQSGIAFRYAGVVAPWNWQVSFAALLAEQPDPALRGRAEGIVQAFLAEWTTAEDGALWRYWPRDFYREKGLTEAAIDQERFEDTGHAAISLQALARFPERISPAQADAVARRFESLLAYGTAVPRDLDGAGPRSDRWFPAGGWADFAGDGARLAYAGRVPGATSADTLYAYARLVDPAEAFDLTLGIYVCDEICTPHQASTYGSAAEFLQSNPLFEIRDGPKTVEARIRN